MTMYDDRLLLLAIWNHQVLNIAVDLAVTNLALLITYNVSVLCLFSRNQVVHLVL